MLKKRFAKRANVAGRARREVEPPLVGLSERKKGSKIGATVPKTGPLEAGKEGE